MTLKTFIIKNLFYKYDITIRCDEKCVILLGVNGVGKTTVLNILKCYMDNNFIDICAAPFELLDIEFNESPDHYIIEYYDLFPALTTLTENYKKHRIKLMDEPEWNESIDAMYMNDIKAPEEMGNELLDVLYEISKEKKYGEFVYNLYKKRKQPLIIQNIIEKKLSYEDLLAANIVRESFSPFLKAFEGSEFSAENDLSGSWLGNVENVFFNAVENITIDNSWALNSLYVDKDIEWAEKCPSVYFDRDLLKQKALEKEYHNFTDSDEIINKLEISARELFEEGDPLLFPKNDLEKSVYAELVKNKIFRLNRLINLFYYDEIFVIDINNRAKKYVERYYDLKKKSYKISDDFPLVEKDEKDLYEDTMKYYSNDVIRDYYEYLRPILVQNSFFDMEIEFKTDPQVKNSYGFDDYPTHKFLVKRLLLKEYLDEVLPLLKCKDNRSIYTKRYEEAISKYFVNKYVEVKPCGIQIKESEIRNQTDSQYFVLYSNNDIDLSIISSGEKKILIIFAIAIYSNGIMFIDEPELSLSLLWQETLIPDILHYGNIKHLYIATHSPFISRDDELEKYLYYLPQKEI